MSRQTQMKRILILSAVLPLMAAACDMTLDEPVESLEDGQEYEMGAIDIHTENSVEHGPTVLGAPAPSSAGLYAIPYHPGVDVRVHRDHLNHTPKNRIDMGGVSGGPYELVAAAGGVVRFIEDSHNVNGGCENNNYVWVEHPNGEWTKYSHIAQHSASVDAGLSVGDSIEVGQFLGIESNVGCASGDHLHFEVAVPDDPTDPIDPVGGYIKGDNLVPRVCGISGNTYVAGTTYEVPDVRPGFSEYARHGLADSDFQKVFNAVATCGYRMDWNDGFERNGGAAFNVIFHQNENPNVSWRSHRRLTEAQLIQKKTDYAAQGYRHVHVDVYNIGTAIRYAAIFKKGDSVPATASYVGVTAAQHQNIFNNWTAAGWRPRVISATSVNGTRTYAGLFTHGSIGSWQARSFQTSAQYQNNYTANQAAGRRLIYLNSYVHNGAARYTAIWASSAAPNVFAKHGQTSGQHQAHWSNKVSSGWLTGAVTGMQVGGLTRYAAYWEK